MSDWMNATTAPGYQTEVHSMRVGGSEFRIRTLSDRQQYYDPDGSAERAGISSATWPLFGMLWPAGLALAEEMSQFPIEGRRILEVGCGTGLASLVLRKRGADITASDHHPLAGEFLNANAELNGLPPVNFQQAQWQGPNPHLGRFDLIIGSDVLYERDHPALLAGFLAAHAQATACVVISDPGREHRGRFGALMIGQGYARTERRFRKEGKEEDSRGRILIFTRD
jgi:predicted nicotinamide N-methyase